MPLSAALILLGLLTHFDQSAQRAPKTGPGIIAGVVINAQREPVAGAAVQVFPAPASTPKEHAPFTTSAIGQATTDSQGRFRITGLPLGEYLVGARMHPSRPPDAAPQPLMYAATFYPSTTDHQAAMSVSAVADVTEPVQIALVQVKGVRMADLTTPSRPSG